jgi:hypothetical protein
MRTLRSLSVPSESDVHRDVHARGAIHYERISYKMLISYCTATDRGVLYRIEVRVEC